MNSMKKLISFTFLTITLLCVSCKVAQLPIYDFEKSITVSEAGISTAHPEATQIGYDILKKGGNAVDAAIATQFALAVCYPVAGNIGGGGFMVYRDKNGFSTTLDFREMAPSKAFPDMYLDENGDAISELSRAGHLACGVPGSVGGMWEAFQKYSALKDWKALVQPSVDLANKGFKITEAQANKFNNRKDEFKKYNTSPNAFNSDKIWKPGDKLVQKDLGNTMAAIRDNGRAGFYQGWVADKIVDEMNRGNGIISHDDLKNYTAIWRDPVIGEYKDLKIISMPPPSSGGVFLVQMLDMIEPYNIGNYGLQSKEAVHLIVESERRAYADRATHLGDMDFYPVPLDDLMDQEYIHERMSDFDPTSATNSDEIMAGDFVESEQTTHFSIVDAAGNAVSITTTINTAYGNKVVVGGAGFFLNNEMDDFSAKPGVPNFFGLLGAEANKVEPGKRMLSSMTPTIVEQDGKLKLVVGTPGGSTIITSVYQTILNIFDFGLSPNEAVQQARFHHQWKPNLVFHEGDCLSDEVKKSLTDMGHELKKRGNIGRVEVIYVNDNGSLDVVADKRGDDHAMGY